MEASRGERGLPTSGVRTFVGKKRRKRNLANVNLKGGVANTGVEMPGGHDVTRGSEKSSRELSC